MQPCAASISTHLLTGSNRHSTVKKVDIYLEAYLSTWFHLCLIALCWELDICILNSACTQTILSKFHLKQSQERSRIFCAYQPFPYSIFEVLFTLPGELYKKISCSLRPVCFSSIGIRTWVNKTKLISFTLFKAGIFKVCWH